MHSQALRICFLLSGCRFIRHLPYCRSSSPFNWHPADITFSLCAREEIVNIHISGRWLLCSIDEPGSRYPIVRDTDKDRTFLGTFLEDITADPTGAYVVDVNNGTGLTSGELAFCDVMEMIEQPSPHRNQSCPPEKGFALISTRAFLPWYLGAVRPGTVFNQYQSSACSG